MARTAFFLRPRRRRGAATLELIIGLPVLLIAVIGIVELGLLATGRQDLKRASRNGAEAASQIALPGANPVPAPIVSAIERTLQEQGIAPAQIEKIFVQHNYVNPLAPVTLTHGAGTCPTPALPMPVLPANCSECGRWVKVTVCVKSTSVAPNCLAFYGFDLANRTMHEATVYRHE